MNRIKLEVNSKMENNIKRSVKRRKIVKFVFFLFSFFIYNKLSKYKGRFTNIFLFINDNGKVSKLTRQFVTQ